MDASLTDVQQMLLETAARVADRFGPPNPMLLPNDDDDAESWRALGATGLLAMHAPEELGGGGGHSSDVALVVEQLGRRTCLVPYLGQGVIGPELALAGDADPRFLVEITDGSARVCVALSVDLRRLARADEEALAWDARGATTALAVDDAGRLVAMELTELTVDQADVTRVVRHVSAGAPAEVISAPLSPDARCRWEAYALAMLSADLVGVAQGALDAAVDHVGARRQFGVPVGTFQAVQHLAADAAVHLEAARASMWHAAWAADDLGPGAALLAARQAKVVAANAALAVVETQTQLLGGIAITWEERAHLRVRRVLLDRLTLGDVDVHLDAIADTRVGAR